MKIVILVPYRHSDSRREQLWSFTRKWLEHNHPWWPIVLGASPEGPFNRSAAINDAARQVEWDLAVIHDADTVVPADQLSAAASAAEVTNRLAFSFTSVADLSESCTDHILDTGDISLRHLTIDSLRTAPLATQSSSLVVTRDLWDKIGGFDEAFVGWSAEDNAFCHAATVLGGEPRRIPGNAFHLWHESGRPPANDLNYISNQKRWRRYQFARTPNALAALRQ